MMRKNGFILNSNTLLDAMSAMIIVFVGVPFAISWYLIAVPILRIYDQILGTNSF